MVGEMDDRTDIPNQEKGDNSRKGAHIETIELVPARVCIENSVFVPVDTPKDWTLKEIEVTRIKYPTATRQK